METADQLVRLGKSDIRVSRLGLGAMVWGHATGLARLTPAQTAYGPADSREAEQGALNASVAAGINFIDTAAMYANGVSERRVGELTRDRKDLVVATKFPPSITSRPADFTDALAGSLGNLGRSTIDLYQHHFPSKRVPIPELMNLMADAVEAGKVRAVGVSNYSEDQMRLAHAVLEGRGIPLASNQVEYSLLRRQPETDGVLDACQELGVTFIAYSPLAGGALTGKYEPGTKARGLRRFIMHRFRRSGLEELVPVIALLREIGVHYSMSPNQVAIRWLMEKPGVIPIPGAKNAEQAASNAAALTFSLEPAEVEALDAATIAWQHKGR